MKTTLRVLSVMLTIGALTQTIYSYAYESQPISIEAEEGTLIQLIELNQKRDSQDFSYQNFQPDSAMPEIKNKEDFKEAFVRHALRYIQAIGGEKALSKIIKAPEFQSLRRDDPTI